MGRKKPVSLPPEDCKIGTGEEAIVLANVAERAERYDDMIEYMKDRVKAGKALSREEREMLSAAFKEEAEKEKNAALAAGYLSKASHFKIGDTPKAETGEPIVFYKKLQVSVSETYDIL
eukprot:Skav232778  [mRNA]  locus=scaffold614:141304:143321:- [translate_table: standard]